MKKKTTATVRTRGTKARAAGSFHWDIERMGLPTMADLPGPDLWRNEYIAFLVELKRSGSFFDRGKSWISWVTGECLNLLLNSRNYKRGDYKEARRRLKLKKTTAYYCREIAKHVAFENVRKMEFMEILYHYGIIKPKKAAPDPDNDRELREAEPEQEGKGRDASGIGLSSQSASGEGKGKKVKKGSPAKVTYRNVIEKLGGIGQQVAEIEKMEPPNIELRDHLALYDSIRSKAVEVINRLKQVIRTAEQEMAKARPGGDFQLRKTG